MNTKKLTKPLFKSPFITSSMTLIGTHRGISEHSTKEIENTCSALFSSENATADFIECDVMITADNYLILFHDENEKNIIIEKTTLKNIKKYIPKITTLEELFKKNNTENNIKLLNIELKTYHLSNEKKDIYSKHLTKLIELYKHSNKVMVSSFDQTLLKKINHWSNTICLALIFEKIEDLNIDPLLKHHLSIVCPHIKSISKSIKLGLPCIPWEHSNENTIYSTLKSKKNKHLWLKQHHIIGLTTNEVEKTTQLLNKN